MRFIQHFRPLLDLGSCKEFVMAKNTTETGKRRVRKAASIQPPVAIEPRKETVTVSAAPVSNLEEQIRRRAYELYLQRGGTPGNPSHDWLVAEQEVRSRHTQHAG